MKKYTFVLILLLLSFSVKAEDVFVVVSATVSIDEYDRSGIPRQRHYMYVSPVIKIKKERFKAIYAEDAFRGALTKRHRFHKVLGIPNASSFADRKEARQFYKKQKEVGYYRLSFTRTSIEKKWRGDQKK